MSERSRQRQAERGGNGNKIRKILVEGDKKELVGNEISCSVFHHSCRENLQNSWWIVSSENEPKDHDDCVDWFNKVYRSDRIYVCVFFKEGYVIEAFPLSKTLENDIGHCVMANILKSPSNISMIIKSDDFTKMVGDILSCSVFIPDDHWENFLKDRETKSYISTYSFKDRPDQTLMKQRNIFNLTPKIMLSSPETI